MLDGDRGFPLVQASLSFMLTHSKAIDSYIPNEFCIGKKAKRSVYYSAKYYTVGNIS